MAGKTSIRNQRAAESALAFFEVNADDVGSTVDQRLAPYLEEGEQATRLGHAVRLIGRSLRPTLEAANAADREHSIKKAEEAAARHEVAVAAAEVRSQMVFIRRLFTACFGRRRGNYNAGMTGRTPAVAQPELLWRLGEFLLDRLRNAEFEPPRRKNRSRPVDRKALAADLKPAFKSLEKAINALTVARRRLKAAEVAKAAATKRLNTELHDGVSFVAALGRLAGRRELARCLTASVRRLVTGKR